LRVGAGLLVVGFLHAAKRRTANLSARSMRFLLVRSGVLAVGLGFVAWYLNRTRGIGWMFVLFVVLALVLHYALTSTKWGKAFYAVGAAGLAAANQASGGGDVNLNGIAAAVIGGTSLFGGRGTAFAAVLGVLVIQSISSGLTLLSLDSSYRFFVTGVVPLLAVGVDSLARRSRTTHGRA
jgi:D-xylose transport system permease protein